MATAKQGWDKEQLNHQLSTELMKEDEDMSLDTCLQMIKDGADVDTISQIGRTTLMRAAELGRIDIVKACIENGADIHLKANKLDGGSALVYAVIAKQVECIRFLAENGANCSHTLGYRNTPLLCNTILGGRTDIVKILIEHDASLDAKDKDGDCAIGYYAAYSNTPGIYEALIDKGAEINTKNKDKETPLMFATRYERMDAVALLLQHGAEVDAQDRVGKTALMIACTKGNREAVHLLLEQGACADLCDNQGDTSIDYAHGFNNAFGEAVKEMSKRIPFEVAAKRGTLKPRKILRPSKRGYNA
ncbi:MAG: ankyrin repeat domain-containing protein [Alphaproteobacteria bacterium]|nr:ankyrin repeat domain-containing protein [Alphaproteobacteria bacterium]